MYWFYSEPGWGIGLWLLSLGLVAAGGWLLATHLFTLERHERVIAGFSTGLVLYLWTVNWVGRVLPPFWTFVGSALFTMLAGLVSAWGSRRPWLDFKDWKIGGWLAAGAGLWWLFFRVSKGTGLFDEYKNLALISTLANGWIPAVAHYGQPELLRYHYGFHLLGAGLMQLAHLMPWSAFDVSKAMVWSISLLLAGLVGERYLGRRGALVLACAVALAAGTRYLLLLLPSGLMADIERHVGLSGVGSSIGGSLTQALSADLPMEASPRIGYPFAFLSGINPSYVMAHGGEQTIEPLLFMLSILLIGRSSNKFSVLFYAVLFSFWALASETSYGLFALAWAILSVWRFARKRVFFWQEWALLYPTLGLLLSIPLAILGGGAISAVAQQWAFPGSVAVSSVSHAQASLLGFSFRWPPAIVSGQMTSMSLFDPAALLVGILEMGPVVVLLPWMTYLWWRQDKGNWLLQVLIFIAWLGVIIPLFVRWVSEQDISHFSDFGLDTAVVLLVFMLFRAAAAPVSKAGRAFVISGLACLVLMCIPGMVLMGVQLTAAQDTILSEHYGEAEAGLVQQAWGRLPASAKMLGGVGAPSILTGQLTAGIYTPPSGSERPIWDAMLVAPKLSELLQAGFGFVYVDWRWWNALGLASQRELSQPCITVFAKSQENGGAKFIEILDLRGCR